METELAKLKHLLKSNGYSLTKSRRKVFLTLLDRQPQSMSKVISQVQNSTDRASVYRTISLFEKLGIVERMQIGWKYKIELSEMFREHHHHLTCVKCQTVKDVMGRYNLEVVIDSTARDAGFDPLSHYLEIHGICADCQANQN